jgi:hypothetical protein
MQDLRFLPVVLALGLLSGCEKSDVDAAGDSVKGAAQEAGASLDSLMKDLDLSKIATLDAAKLQQIGKDAMASIAAQLESIKDLPSAQKVSSAITPVLGKLESVKTALGNKLPNVEEVKTAIASLTTKFKDSEVMKAIEPMLTQLQSLVG